MNKRRGLPKQTPTFDVCGSGRNKYKGMAAEDRLKTADKEGFLSVLAENFSVYFSDLARKMIAKKQRVCYNHIAFHGKADSAIE